MKAYEAPQINFEKLILFEKIAGSCWASSKIGFNDPLENPMDPEIETTITISSANSDCGQSQLNEFLAGVSDYYHAPGQLTKFKNRFLTNGGTYSDAAAAWAVVPQS